MHTFRSWKEIFAANPDWWTPSRIKYWYLLVEKHNQLGLAVDMTWPDHRDLEEAIMDEDGTHSHWNTVWTGLPKGSSLISMEKYVAEGRGN